jgi:hypothetical protein
MSGNCAGNTDWKFCHTQVQTKFLLHSSNNKKPNPQKVGQAERFLVPESGRTYYSVGGRTQKPKELTRDGSTPPTNGLFVKILWTCKIENASDLFGSYVVTVMFNTGFYTNLCTTFKLSVG